MVSGIGSSDKSPLQNSLRPPHSDDACKFAGEWNGWGFLWSYKGGSCLQDSPPCRDRIVGFKLNFFLVFP